MCQETLSWKLKKKPKGIINAKAKLNLNRNRNIQILSLLKQSQRMKPTGTALLEKTNQVETKKEGRKKNILKSTHRLVISKQVFSGQNQENYLILRKSM